jgi:hypothetical protein
MDVVYRPARKQRAPRPPWRTAFVQVGTIARRDDAYWVLEEKSYPTDHGMAWLKKWRLMPTSEYLDFITKRPATTPTNRLDPAGFDYLGAREKRVKRQIDEQRKAWLLKRGQD